MQIDFAKMDRAFNPQCVAIVGDKAPRLQWIHGHLGFQGKLYSVQISPPSIEAIESLGVKNYTSLLDIPEQIDLVIVAVPRKVTPQILEDCISKGVAAVHFFTAGFTETETSEGRKLEEQIIRRAKQANLYLIGPNCMGIFNPSIGLKQHPEQYTGFSGPVGLISQSGTHARNFSLEGHLEGLDIKKSVSFGNGVVLDAPDYLEYFAHDESIKIVGMYLEGVRNGRRFFSVLREAASRKPVVIWKGGRSEEGVRATTSHTFSLAIPQAVWSAAINQAGAIAVSNMGELIDTMQALLYLPPVLGKRVVISGGSGGQSVALADAFAEAGLGMPTLTQESYSELSEFFTTIGASYRNPIDTGMANRENTKRIIETIVKDANIDNIVLLILAQSGWFWDTPQDLERELNLITDIKRRTSKPIIVITPFYTPSHLELARYIGKKLRESGIPVFSSFERGARALKNAFDYYNFRKSLQA